LRAATCVADITPKCAVHLCGYVGEARKHTAKGVHDSPLAVSLLLEIDTVTLLFISIDVVTLGGEKAAAIKKQIKEVLPIDRDHIIIHAVHTHSAANGLGDEAIFDTPDNPEYFAYVSKQITESVKALPAQLQEVTAWIDTCKIHGYYSKRTDKTLPFEDNGTIIKFMHNDSVVAAMCNFNCHATVLGMDNMLLSADLIGKVRSLMKDHLGVIPYTFTGASGDISNRQYRQGNDFQELERVGTGIAHILKQMDSYEELHLSKVKTTVYDHPVHYDNTVFYADYRKGIAQAEAVLSRKDATADERKLAASEILLLKMKLQTAQIDFHVRGILLHMNELTIVTFPGELASAFGLQLRAACKTKHFLLIGYANDYQGYFMEAQEYGKTYETKASNTPVGESERIACEIGDLL